MKTKKVKYILLFFGFISPNFYNWPWSTFRVW